MDDLDFQTWLAYGQERGWVSEGVCQIHDEPVMTEAEEEEMYVQGGDPCVPILRVWVDAT